MKKLLKFLTGLVCGGLTGCGGAAAPGSVPADAVIIDVRTVQEYRAGHLAAVPQVPYEQLPGRIAEFAPDKNTPIYLYCRSGNRAGRARQALLNLGYTQVTNSGSLEQAQKFFGREIVTEP